MVVESAQRELEKFCREMFDNLTWQEQIVLNKECDRIIHKLKERSRLTVISREQLRYAVICAIYYTAFGESPLMTAVNARGER